MKNKIIVDDKLINELAHLAKLKFDEKAAIKMKKDLKKILQFIAQLSTIKTDNIEPLIYLSEEVNVFREDNICDTVSQKDALKNAPNKDSDYFKVPRVITKG